MSAYYAINNPITSQTSMIGTTDNQSLNTKEEPANCEQSGPHAEVTNVEGAKTVGEQMKNEDHESVDKSTEQIENAPTNTNEPNMIVADEPTAECTNLVNGQMNEDQDKQTILEVVDQQFEKIKGIIELLVSQRNEGDFIYVFLDFDDTLFYKKGFGKLMQEGEYEKAYQLPLIPTAVATHLIQYLPNIPNLQIHMLSKREESTKIRQAIEQYWPKEGLISRYHNQRNVQLEDGRTKSISKGEIIQEFINSELDANKKISGIVLVDDIQENLSSLTSLKNESPFNTMMIETHLHICDE